MARVFVSSATPFITSVDVQLHELLVIFLISHLKSEDPQVLTCPAKGWQ